MSQVLGEVCTSICWAINLHGLEGRLYTLKRAADLPEAAAALHPTTHVQHGYLCPRLSSIISFAYIRLPREQLIARCPCRGRRRTYGSVPRLCTGSARTYGQVSR